MAGQQSAKPIRVMLVDDHELVVGLLRRRLEDEPDIEVVAVAGTGASALAQNVRSRPDVALLDFHLPDVNGLTLARALLQVSPGLRIVIVTADPNAVSVSALEAGCSGYLDKARPVEELIDGVRAVQRGGRVAPSGSRLVIPSLAELAVHYQPIVRLASGEVWGYEALVRWAPPGRELLGPLAFLPAAEHSGFVIEIGRWVTEEACRQVALWNYQRGEALAGGVHVNLSAVEIASPGLVAGVADALTASGLPPRQLTLELTETMLLGDEDGVRRTIEELDGLGCRIAVDDLGTGYSSLSYLRRFNIAVAKVDKSFVDHVPASHRDVLLLRSIAQMGRTMGLELIAEGVERAEQAEELRASGYDLVQGFLYGRPVSADAIDPRRPRPD